MAPKALLLGLAILALAAPSAAFTQWENTNGTCHLIGDGDVYGVGVRISYYLAFFAGVISLYSLKHEAVEDVKKGNAIIGLAILIILIRNAVDGSLAVFEWQLVYTMMFLLMSAAFIPLTIMGNRGSSVALCVVYGLYSLLLPWTVFTLAEQGRREDCQLYGFVFRYFDFYNPHWVGFLKFEAIITCLLGVCFIIAGFFLLVFSFTKGGADKLDKSDIEEASGVIWYFATVGLVTGVVGIAFTEMLIKGNNIDLSDAPFLSTSQLIPFLVGIFTFISSLWSLFGPKEKEE